MKKHGILIFFLVNLVFGNGKAQVQGLDSLTHLISNRQTTDSIKINALTELGQLYSDDSKQDSAQFFYEKAVILAKNNNNRKAEANLYKLIGISYELSGNYDKEANYLYKALKLSEQIEDKHTETSVLINLGILNFNLRKANSALQYYGKALKIALEQKDTISQIRVYNNIGNVYMTLNEDFKNAEPYFKKTVELGRKTGFKSAVKVGLTNLTEIYAHTKQFDKALNTCNQVLQMNPTGCYALYNLGSIWYLQKKPDKAIHYMTEALKYTQSEPELKQVILKDIAKIYSEKGDYRNSLDYYMKYSTLKDSVHTIQAEKHIIEIETKYETEKRKKEIEILTGEKKLRNIYIYSLIIILCISVVTALLGFRNIRNKKLIAEQIAEIRQQKIVQLENERQVTASHAVIQGEDAERTRLARDLHDGLGGMLSGVKLTLTTLKGNYLLSQENVDQFDHALNLLDNSIKEMRRISHNMMPEALVKFGLKDALQDFVAEVDKNKQHNIGFQFFGNYKRIESTLETTLYRIAQELINNAIKHSGGTVINLQLVQEINRIHLSVLDDGKGFDISSVNTKKSAGLQNIKARVESFNGRIEIDSSIGKGTEIGVEFTI